MKIFEHNVTKTVLAFFLMCGFAGPMTVFAASPVTVDLGSAGNYTVLSKTGISTTGTTSIIGNIGLSPAAATYLTGFALSLPAAGAFSTSARVSGNVYAPCYASPTPANLTTAIGDMQTAYADATGRAPSVTELGAGNIGGLTLAPGVYKWSSGLAIPTDVTLSGSATDVWIFQVAQNLNLSPAAKIILSGGAQAGNIFWVVAGQTTIGTTAVFSGNILDQTAIVLRTGATLNGRALAQTAVTLDSNTVTGPVVSVSTPTPVSAVPTTKGGSVPEPALPHLVSVMPPSALVGTTVEIYGDNLIGFEGDSYFLFERADGKLVKIRAVITETNANHTPFTETAQMVLKEPCEGGQTVVDEYSGLSSLCDYVQLTQGTYKVYTEPWGNKSNILDFTVTVPEVPTLTLVQTPAPVLVLAPAIAACTKDAMRCPDGSYVGRVGPDCAFAACGTSVLTPTSPVLTFGQQVKTIATHLGQGNKSDNVKILQQYLISQNKGSAAAALSRVGATSYFGPLTRAALAEFQSNAGIKSPWGNFGPLTRAYLNANE